MFKKHFLPIIPNIFIFPFMRSIKILNYCNFFVKINFYFINVLFSTFITIFSKSWALLTFPE